MQRSNGVLDSSSRKQSRSLLHSATKNIDTGSQPIWTRQLAVYRQISACGQKRTFHRLPHDVCYWGYSGHRDCLAKFLLSTQSGHLSKDCDTLGNNKWALAFPQNSRATATVLTMRFGVQWR